MLHLGCGAGGHDYHFKRHFSVTGVDLSEGMLEIARKRNPEIQYLQGDMRTINLDRKFDVVAIPDSIMYMTTLEDLSAALSSAAAHLKRDGLLLVVAHTKEEFRNNNFAYTGEADNTHITVLENNHIVSDTAYEATIVYLIRQSGRLEIHHEVHTLGLPPYPPPYLARFSERRRSSILKRLMLPVFSKNIFRIFRLRARYRKRNK